jgi:hypothetical protein
MNIGTFIDVIINGVVFRRCIYGEAYGNEVWHGWYPASPSILLWVEVWHDDVLVEVKKENIISYEKTYTQ